MLYLRLMPQTAYNADDVKAYRQADIVTLDIMVDGKSQVLTLTVVDRFLWWTKQAVVTGLDLDEDNRVVVCRHDIYVTTPRFPVALYDGVTFPLQILCSKFLAPFAKHIM